MTLAGMQCFVFRTFWHGVRCNWFHRIFTVNVSVPKSQIRNLYTCTNLSANGLCDHILKFSSLLFYIFRNSKKSLCFFAWVDESSFPYSRTSRSNFRSWKRNIYTSRLKNTCAFFTPLYSLKQRYHFTKYPYVFQDILQILVSLPWA